MRTRRTRGSARQILLYWNRIESAVGNGEVDMRLELLGAVVALTSGIVAEDLSRHVDVFTGTGSVGTMV